MLPIVLKLKMSHKHHLKIQPMFVEDSNCIVKIHRFVYFSISFAYFSQHLYFHHLDQSQIRTGGKHKHLPAVICLSIPVHIKRSS